MLYHPDDVLYVGDQVSIEVISPPGMDVKDATVQVQVDPPGGPTFGPVNFGAWGIQGRQEATLLWVWDTRKEAAGPHTITYSVLPIGSYWTENVTLLPAEAMPPAEASAHWATAQSQCCAVFYITDTATERDLSLLTSLMDSEAQDAVRKMSANFTQPITVTILPRLLGHGGFTSSEISVSYLDRNYASNSWALVLHHEMIHAIDGHLGGDYRPSLFVEGLAVYMTGGHYKLEPLSLRAAALLGTYLNMYVPLDILANDFYSAQHEIGYLEAASLIEYMVGAYGADAFSSFYRDIHIRPGEKPSEAIDAALQSHFSISFAQLEKNYLDYLGHLPVTSTWVDDVRLTVTYYDTMRHYQQLLDPSAYFRTAWLLDNKSMRERNIVADYVRHPHAPDNLALETLFITAGQQMMDYDYAASSQTLDEINKVLSAFEAGSADPFSTSQIASAYLSIAMALDKLAYEVQRIDLVGDAAIVIVTSSSSPDLIKLHLDRVNGEWSVSP